MDVLKIVYDKPNIYSLPYNVKGSVHFFDFKPGINEIGKETWDLIRKENEPRLDYVDSVLKTFDPKPSKTLDTKAKTDAAARLKKGDYNVSEMDFEDIKVLADNTFEASLLKKYIGQEKTRTSPRKNIIKALDDQLKIIVSLEAKADAKE